MYVGRIVAIGNTQDNKLAIMYRVSARSFPNRRSVQMGEAIAIIPEKGFEEDIHRNPYITYNCLRINQRYAVAGNGTQTDPIIEKLSSGMNARDAVASVLIGLDYEHDHLNTPRIAAVIDLDTRSGTLGIIRSDAILIRSFALDRGDALYLATYEHNYPDERFKEENFHAANPEEACDFVLGKGAFEVLEKPVSAACAFENSTGFSIGYKNLRERGGGQVGNLPR